MKLRDGIDRLEQFAVDVILKRRFGWRAGLLLVGLHALSWIYAWITRLRLWLYQERLMTSTSVGALVVSVGNLTVGGTGKTPVVETFARALQARGRRVAILSRGYKSKAPPLWDRLMDKLGLRQGGLPPRVVSDGRSLLLDSRRAGDEPFMLASNLHGIPVLVDKDRVKAASYAVARFGVDTLVLDDGLQYLPLAPHRLDVVLIDKQMPFGNEYLLPRGTLREPHDHLRRADLIFLTKCDGSDTSALRKRIASYNQHAPIIECRHRPLYLQDLLTDEQRPLDWIAGLQVASLCGIAAPESFEGFLRQVGADIVFSRQFNDHHRYSTQDIQRFLKRAAPYRPKAILTTEKDAVRFPSLSSENVPIPIFFLRVEIEILQGADIFQKQIEALCHTSTAIQ